MLSVLIVRNEKLRGWDVLQWHNANIRFRENRFTVQKIKGHTHNIVISCLLFSF